VKPDDDSAEAIRNRMAELRRDLTCDVSDVSRSVREVGRTAREMASPLYLIRNYPWVSAAVVAATGYLLVPKKKQVVNPDPEVLAELVRKQQVKLDTTQASSETKGMLKSLVVMGVTWAARTGMNYMVQRLTTAALNKGSEEPQPAESASVEEPWNTSR